MVCWHFGCHLIRNTAVILTLWHEYNRIWFQVYLLFKDRLEKLSGVAHCGVRRTHSVFFDSADLKIS